MRNPILRNRISPIIAKVIADVGSNDVRLLRRELRKKYPYGEWKHYPYKVWLSEVRSQLDTSTRKGKKRNRIIQLSLFEDTGEEEKKG
jgi:hypothetical protein